MTTPASNGTVPTSNETVWLPSLPKQLMKIATKDPCPKSRELAKKIKEYVTTANTWGNLLLHPYYQREAKNAIFTYLGYSGAQQINSKFEQVLCDERSSKTDEFLKDLHDFHWKTVSEHSTEYETNMNFTEKFNKLADSIKSINQQREQMDVRFNDDEGGFYWCGIRFAY